MELDATGFPYIKNEGGACEMTVVTLRDGRGQVRISVALDLHNGRELQAEGGGHGNGVLLLYPKGEQGTSGPVVFRTTR